jgi:hypothetical protein
VSWWVIFPGFLVVVLALVRDRACFDRTYPLPDVATRPMFAWLVAGVYLFAHGWLVAAYGFTVSETRRLLPRIEQVRQTWGPAWPQLLATIGLFALEYGPVKVWTGIARVTGCDL